MSTGDWARVGVIIILGIFTFIMHTFKKEDDDEEIKDEYTVAFFDELKDLPPFDKEDYSNAKKAYSAYEEHCVLNKDGPRPGNYLKDYAAYYGVKNMDLLKLAQIQWEKENEKSKL